MNHQPEQYTFSAMLSRMKYINRWGLMRNTRQESLSEHTCETAMLAHLLALIATQELGQKNINPEQIAICALYHDASEILTGDLPTPVKYHNENLQKAYKALEKESAHTLTHTLPNSLQAFMAPYLLETSLNEQEKQLLKAADRLSALIKCLEEEASGNTEFISAKKQQLNLLKQADIPAVNYFLEHFLPSYQQNLDQLTNGMF